MERFWLQVTVLGFPRASASKRGMRISFWASGGAIVELSLRVCISVGLERFLRSIEGGRG